MTIFVVRYNKVINLWKKSSMLNLRSERCNFTKKFASKYAIQQKWQETEIDKKTCTCEGSSRRKAFSKVAWVLRSKNCFITHLTLANSLRVPPRNTKQQPALFFAKPIIGKKKSSKLLVSIHVWLGLHPRRGAPCGNLKGYSAAPKYVVYFMIF